MPELRKLQAITRAKAARESASGTREPFYTPPISNEELVRIVVSDLTGGLSEVNRYEQQRAEADRAIERGARANVPEGIGPSGVMSKDERNHQQ